MFELIMEAGSDLLSNLLQIVVSSILSILLYYFIKKQNVQIRGIHNKTGEALSQSDKGSLITDLLLIAAASLLGLILPLNTYGILPVLFIMLKLGFRSYIVLPVISSNIIFNMLVPFSDPSFIWRTGLKRVMAAFVLGLLAGIMLRSLKHRDDLFKLNKVPFLFDGHLCFKSVLMNIYRNIATMGIYLIIGVIVNTLFNKYIIFNLTSFIFMNPHTAFLPHIFARFNVVHPGFLLAVSILYALMNLTNLSAILVILKPKSFILYICYFAGWIILLSCTMFI